MTWTFVLPWATPSLNAIKVMHWAKLKRLKSQWLELLLYKSIKIPRATGKRRITIIRFGARQLDHDNFVGGCKEVLVDNIRASGGTAKRQRRGVGIILDDDSSGAEINYFQVKCSKGDQRTEVKVEDL